jgi:hypothetical protein
MFYSFTDEAANQTKINHASFLFLCSSINLTAVSFNKRQYYSSFKARDLHGKAENNLPEIPRHKKSETPHLNITVVYFLFIQD